MKRLETLGLEVIARVGCLCQLATNFVYRVEVELAVQVRGGSMFKIQVERSVFKIEANQLSVQWRLLHWHDQSRTIRV